MAKNWYPVIDILTCMECGTCVNFCPHGVYDKQKAPVPVVVNPDGCIDHCHGCQKKCPAGAIAYVGDTGDQPIAAPVCCCNAEPETVKGRQLRIEYLYLDLNTCDRCIGTDAVLDEVVAVLRPCSGAGRLCGGLSEAGNGNAAACRAISFPFLAHYLGQRTGHFRGRTGVQLRLLR